MGGQSTQNHNNKADSHQQLRSVESTSSRRVVLATRIKAVRRNNCRIGGSRAEDGDDDGDDNNDDYESDVTVSSSSEQVKRTCARIP